MVEDSYEILVNESETHYMLCVYTWGIPRTTQTSRLRLFATIVNGFQPLTISQKVCYIFLSSPSYDSDICNYCVVLSHMDLFIFSLKLRY